MKTIWRIVAILSAALVVVGALIALRQTEVLARLLPEPDRASLAAGVEHDRFAPGRFERDKRSGFVGDGFVHHHDAERKADARGIIEAVKNLLIIGVIIALVVGASPIVHRFLRRRSPPRAAAGIAT